MANIEPQQLKPPQPKQDRTVDLPPGGGAGVRTPVGPEVFTPNLDRGRVFLIWLFQLAVFVAGIGICFYIGVSAWFWITGTITIVFLSGGLGWLMWRNAITPDPLPPRSCLFWHMKAGTWLTSLTILAAALALGIRINWQGKESIAVGVFLCVFLLLLGIATFFLSRYAIRLQSTPWFQFAVGVTMIPLVTAWFLASATAAWVKPRFQGSVTSRLEDITRAEELSKRGRWAEHRGWRTSNGLPISVVLLLSGGGYRAAAFHAGLLKAFDESCVPIRFLSTVSGGSIVGTYYALGFSPDLFRKRLINQQPGLPDELINFWFVLADLFLPWWNSSETYAQHFERAFFSNKTLSDTGVTPTLLINTTDVEAGFEHREVFYRDRSPNYPQLNEIKLSQLVAASAAFPGAFQPKTVVWPAYSLASGNEEPPRPRRFIDGGVVENLGFWGYEVFKSRTKKAPEENVILIVSDASAESPAISLPSKVEPLELLSRSQGISDVVKHGLLSANIRELSKKPHMYAVILKLADVLWPSDAKWTLVALSYPSTTDPNKVRGDTVAEEVAKYPTLHELTIEQVDKAFWVGHALGKDLWTGLNNLRSYLGGKGPECPESSD